MGKKSSGGIFGFVILAALITLAVTGLRLLGELQDWPGFVGAAKEMGGGMAPVGIVWLVPIFGFLFGRKLARGGQHPRSFVRAALPCVLGLAAMAGLFVLSFDEQTERVTEDGVLYLRVGVPFVAFVAGVVAWPVAFGTNLLYGLLARGPVVAVQYLAIANDWGTHYEKLYPEMTADQRGFALMMAQITLWVPFTILVGGLCAAIGAATVRKK